MAEPLRILGVDPGINHLGWAVIELHGPTPTAVAYGVLDVPKGALSERLAAVSRHLSECARRYAVSQAAIERVFVNINPQSTLRLGEARGAAVAALAFPSKSSRRAKSNSPSPVPVERTRRWCSGW